MKNYLILIFLLSLLLSACSVTKNNSNSTTIVEKKEPDIKTKTDTSIIQIKQLGQKDYKIKVGQKISYSYNEHGSVGISAEYDLSDASVLVFKDKIRVYKNPDKSEYPGGDEATVTLIFKAAEKGIVDLVVRSLFRGKTEDEFKFKITVE
jgi:predicted secreted protein